MGRKSEKQREYVVSCRLNKAEMEVLKKMTLIDDCSKSELLRRGLHCLAKGTRSDPGLRVYTGKNEQKGKSDAAA